MAASAAGATQEVLPAVPTPPSSPATSPSRVNGHGRAATSETGRFYSPLVRSLAEKHGVALGELDSIVGSGQGGRVTKQDFLTYLDSRQGGAQVATVLPAATPIVEAAVPAPAPVEYKAPVPDMPGSEWGADGTKIVPMSNMRQLIADHMVRSKQTSPHVYSVQEVDCSRIAKWRAIHKQNFKKTEEGGLTFQEKMKPLFEKMNKVLEQNSEIAKGIVAVADLVNEMKPGTGAPLGAPAPPVALPPAPEKPTFPIAPKPGMIAPPPLPRAPEAPLPPPPAPKRRKGFF